MIFMMAAFWQQERWWWVVAVAGLIAFVGDQWTSSAYDRLPNAEFDEAWERNWERWFPWSDTDPSNRGED